jgi:hypothetical protein
MLLLSPVTSRATVTDRATVQAVLEAKRPLAACGIPECEGGCEDYADTGRNYTVRKPATPGLSDPGRDLERQRFGWCERCLHGGTIGMQCLDCGGLIV